MIEKSYDATLFDYLVTIPSVAKGCGYKENVTTITTQELLDALGKDNAFVLIWKNLGGFIITRAYGTTYTVHTMFSPKAPSSEVLAACEAGFAHMFLDEDCTELRTSASHKNKPAMHLCFKTNWRPLYTTPSMVDENTRDTLFVKTIEEWIIESSWLGLIGEDFHNSITATHTDCSVHDRFVGAAIEMVQAFNTAKAVRTYNKWAACSNYELALLKDNIITIGNLVITLSEDLANIVGVEET